MKRMLALMVLFVSVALPAMVQAAGTGFYLSPRFLMSIQDTGRMDRSWAMAGSGVEEYSQFTLGGALAAGYDFWPQQMFPIRLEAEFALRGNSEKSWYENGRYLNHVRGVWNNSTLFGNVYWDFHNDSAFTPYIGGGIGIAFNYTGYDFATYGGDRFSASENNVNFAWNAGLGLSYEINEMLALDASYRFVGLGYNEVSAWSNGVKYEIGNDAYNNEFTMGVRFSF